MLQFTNFASYWCKISQKISEILTIKSLIFSPHIVVIPFVSKPYINKFKIRVDIKA